MHCGGFDRPSPKVKLGPAVHISWLTLLSRAGYSQWVVTPVSKYRPSNWQFRYNPFLTLTLPPKRGSSLMPVFDIDLIILDFDGVLTDSRVYVLEDGRETVACHRGDGWGIKLIQQAGIEVLILSTERNPVVSARAKKLAVDCIQNCPDKGKATREIIKSRGLTPERVMYVGNDTNDEGAMRFVGHPVAPADAHPKILELTTNITHASGGYGVVREIADWIVG